MLKIYRRGGAQGLNSGEQLGGCSLIQVKGDWTIVAAGENETRFGFWMCF